MSRAFTLTPVRSALAVAAIAAIAAGCGGGGASTGEFVTKVDTICGDAERAVSKIDFGTVDPTSDEATAADLEKFAVALDKALAVYRDEADRLHELEPPSLFQTQFTDSMNALATSLTEIHRASIEARNGDKAAVSSSLGDLSLYGENACGGVSGLFVLTGDDLNAVLPGKERNVDWSPDGQWIASPAGPAPETDILSADGGARHSVESWAWSPDGSRIAYARGDTLFAGRGWSKTRLVAHAAGSDPLDWAPDGSRFVFGRGRTSSCCWPSLSVARADGTGARTLWTPPSDGPDASWINDAYWSPTGRQIAVSAIVNNGVASRGGGDFLYLLDPDRPGATKLADTANAGFRQWSPDGRWLVLASDDSVYRLSPRGGKVQALCPSSCPNARLSADASRFAFVTRHGTSKAPFTLWIADIGRGTKRRVANLPRVSEITWSADGRHLGFALAAADGRHSSIAVIDLATRELRRLTDGSHVDSDPRLSMDGSAAAFRRGQDLWAVGLDGAEERKVMTIGACGRYAWSPTERLLGFTNGPCLPS